tara:strand:- start:1991 stop:3322 length:1332 start_codon:yes stop_codon:yes gene_type:complete
MSDLSHFYFFQLKHFTVLLSLVVSFSLGAQINPPFDFETSETTPVFTNFEMAETLVVENPDASGANTSGNVAQMVRYPGGNVWAGSIITFPDYIDFTAIGAFRLKVYSPVSGAVMKLKLEGNDVIELDALTTTYNEWETLVWDFTGVPGGIFNQLAFMLDFGIEGDGSVFSTFYFDDLELYQSTEGLEQVSLPIDHENDGVHYQTTSFAGNYSELVVDPTDANNHVMKVTKHWQSLNYSGTVMSTIAGLAESIPFEPGATQVNVDVWVPMAGAAIRLKAEESLEPANSVETQLNAPVAGEWTTMSFDFFQHVPGTQAINFNYDYNMLAIFFDFGNEGYVSGIQDFYYDNVVFGDGASSGIATDASAHISLRPNLIQAGGSTVLMFDGATAELEVYDLKGSRVIRRAVNAPGVVDLSCLPAGMYTTIVRTNDGDAHQERLTIVD